MKFSLHPLARGWALFLLALLPAWLAGRGFLAAGLPLPWMLGPMFLSMVLSMGLGVRIPEMPGLRRGSILCLGLYLGLFFRHFQNDDLSTWSTTLALLVLVTLASGWAGYAYLRRWAGIDRVTSWFAGMPAGVNEMIVQGAAFGADQRQVALLQGGRLVLVVFLIPFVVEALTDAEWHRSTSPTPQGMESWLTLAGSMALALGVSSIFRRLRIMAADVTGAVAAGGFLYGFGIIHAPLPDLVLAGAQMVFGTLVGMRFAGMRFSQMIAVFRHSLPLFVIFTLISTLGALLAWQGTGLPLLTLWLAFAPGGFLELSLVTAAIGGDVGLVSTHHLVRMLLIFSLASPALLLVQRAQARSVKPPPAPAPQREKRDNPSKNGNQNKGCSSTSPSDRIVNTRESSTSTRSR